MPCNVSVQTSPDARRWSARQTSVTFPVPTLSPNNRTTIFFVRGYNDHNEVTAVAACVIPATPAAVEWVSRAFKVTHVKHGFDSPADGVTLMSGEPTAVELAPLVAKACSPGYVGEYPDCEPIGDGETSPDPGGSTSGAWGTGDGGSGSSTGGTGSSGTGSEAAPPPDGYDTDPPAAGEEEEEEEEDSRSCPRILSGKVIRAGISVAGILHTFSFEGPMGRLSPALSPVRYVIAHPTVSEDVWWIAEAGWIAVNCTGVYSPSAFGARLWFGTASYAGQSDLHMILGPNHPSF